MINYEGYVSSMYLYGPHSNNEVQAGTDLLKKSMFFVRFNTNFTQNCIRQHFSDIIYSQRLTVVTLQL